MAKKNANSGKILKSVSKHKTDKRGYAPPPPPKKSKSNNDNNKK